MKIWKILAVLTSQISAEENGDDFKGMKEYFIGYGVKRKEHRKAIEAWAKSKENNQLVEIAFNSITSTISSSKEKLSNSNLDDFSAKDFDRSKLGKERNSISSIFENIALLGDLARRVPKQIDSLWEKFEKKEEIVWATQKTKESSLYRFDTEMVENAARNETSSMIAFPVYVLAQELQLFGAREEGYINLYREIRDLPENETQAEFSERHAEMKREKKLDEIERRKEKRKKNGLKPPIVQRKTEL
ncbi:unnamed protein product [Oikopleura dioica]|uniref:Uncharacterized protein n=1 Tax=Oikopleura dioica TaxID=34765 RepID=E4XD43_OIKDI|nr:unnamed protein product [Oikopleura dioica]